jgi:hypothetical protein
VGVDEPEGEPVGGLLCCTDLMVSDEISLRHALEHCNPDVVVATLSLPVSTKTNSARELKKNSFI